MITFLFIIFCIGWLCASINQDKLFHRFYKSYPYCPVWDTKVSNWLIEDDLKLKLPDCVVNGRFNDFYNRCRFICLDDALRAYDLSTKHLDGH